MGELVVVRETIRGVAPLESFISSMHKVLAQKEMADQE